MASVTGRSTDLHRLCVKGSTCLGAACSGAACSVVLVVSVSVFHDGFEISSTSLEATVEGAARLTARMEGLFRRVITPV